MKNAAATLCRLLHALEELGAREDGALAGGDGLAFLDLERRAEPLLRRVAELADGATALSAALRERGRALVATRIERRRRLVRLLETTRDEICLLDATRSRVRALRPAYASQGATLSGPGGFTASA